MTILIASMMMLSADTVRDPALRATLLNSARQPVIAELGKPARLVVRQFRTSGDWAFLLADMVDQAGAPISYAGTSRAEAAAEGVISHAYAALLHRDRGRWTVVTYRIGPTDVAWEDWPKRYGAPQSLFSP